MTKATGPSIVFVLFCATLVWSRQPAARNNMSDSIRKNDTRAGGGEMKRRIMAMSWN
jgi:hypothetical protein